MDSGTKYKVAVKCYTYNQAQYITDTLNGFAMQETDFPFVCCIIDDASTDGEQEVIRKYVMGNFDLSESDVAYEKETDDAYITYARHKSNKNCFFAVLYLKRNLYRERRRKLGLISEWMDNAEYIALCEGDDYWIDANKLRLQVAFLDQHPDYGMCHTDFDLVDGKRNHFVKIHEDGVYWPFYITEGINVGTLTVVYRMSIYKKLPLFFIDQKWPMSDKPLWIEFSRYSKIYYLPFRTAKYRVLESSASHNLDIKTTEFFERKSLEITLFYSDIFNVKINKRKLLSKYYENLMRFAARLSYDNYANYLIKSAIGENSVSLKMCIFFIIGKYKFLKDRVKRRDF